MSRPVSGEKDGPLGSGSREYEGRTDGDFRRRPWCPVSPSPFTLQVGVRSVGALATAVSDILRSSTVRLGCVGAPVVRVYNV